MSWLRSSESRSARSAARRSRSARSPRAALIHTKATNTIDARQREDRDRRLEAERAAAFEVNRERAGQQRHDDRRRQQPARHAAADAIARQQRGDAGVGAQRQRAGAQQQEQQRGVHRHVREREQRLAAEHVTRQAQPAHQQADDRERLVQQRACAGAARTSATGRAGRKRRRWPAPCVAAACRRRSEAWAPARAVRGRRPSRWRARAG